MSLRIPRCAWCGADLRRKGRVAVQYQELPGQPTVAWCIGEGGQPSACWQDDELRHHVHDRSAIGRLPPSDVLRAIERRSPERVSAGKAWLRHGEAL